MSEVCNILPHAIEYILTLFPISKDLLTKQINYLGREEASNRLPKCRLSHFCISATSTGEKKIGKCASFSAIDRNYRVTHVVTEKLMLTSNSKFRHRPASQDKLIAKRNFRCGVNKI